MTVRLGLTGSIGMGKSTTAQMFRDLGVPVWDADASVHRLYAKGGSAVGPVSELCPDAIVDQAIDRDRLKAALKSDPDLLARLEAVVHPLVAKARKAFLAEHEDEPLVVLDIPLLFETGGESLVDATLVVSADRPTQRARVLSRPGMTQDMFQQIMSRQFPDADKRARADYVIETRTIDQARRDVAALVQKLMRETNDA